MAKSHKWTFKSRFRTNAFGWNGTQLAKKRLKEAVSEIKKAYRQDPILAGEGIVSLMERLWPALEHIDSSSGALGTAVNRTLEELIPLLIDAPAENRIRQKWLERLYQAIADDGVDYLSPVEERWGEICHYPELSNQWADKLLSPLKTAWSDKRLGSHVVGTTLCLSSLLYSKRYSELYKLIQLSETPFWHYDKFWAQALVDQGQIDNAIAFAKSRNYFQPPEWEISEFFERVLLDVGRGEEAYQEYALSANYGQTYDALFKKIRKKYPFKNPRTILNDLMDKYGSKGKWFAAAKNASFYDIALECAQSSEAEPSTLVRAARDFLERDPEFSMNVSLCAIHNLLFGYAYEPNPSDILNAYSYCIASAEKLGKIQFSKTMIIEFLGKSHDSHGMKETLQRKMNADSDGMNAS